MIRFRVLRGPWRIGCRTGWRFALVLERSGRGWIGGARLPVLRSRILIGR